jgi:hypothetical protein
VDVADVVTETLVRSPLPYDDLHPALMFLHVPASLPEAQQIWVLVQQVPALVAVAPQGGWDVAVQTQLPVPGRQVWPVGQPLDVPAWQVPFWQVS